MDEIYDDIDILTTMHLPEYNLTICKDVDHHKTRDCHEQCRNHRCIQGQNRCSRRSDDICIETIIRERSIDNK